LLSNPIDIARVAALWANMRDGKTRRPGEDVSPSTYNQRLAILSSWYTFVQETYHLYIPNPIKDVKKRPVQAYATAEPIMPETVEQGLDAINRKNLKACAIMRCLQSHWPLVDVPQNWQACAALTCGSPGDVKMRVFGSHFIAKAARSSAACSMWKRQRCCWTTCIRNLESRSRTFLRMRQCGYPTVGRTLGRRLAPKR
jgi:hypothetical protein